VTLTWQRLAFFAAALGMLAAAVLPLSSKPTASLFARPALLAATLLTAALYAGAAFVTPRLSIAVTFAGVVLGCAVTLALLRDDTIAGYATSGFWLPVVANWGAAWLGVAKLATVKPHHKAASRMIDLAIPLLFGAFLFYLWEVAVRGFGVPAVLFPAPSAIAVRFVGSLWMLWQDFFQTFILGVLTGYVIGCGAGFLVAVLAHRYTFFGRGLLPIGNFVSALPIVGIAPIMVMWFGFDWPSKAAVVVVITFFRCW
jgi:NitT/TauT family transport system permease protein